MSSPRTDVVWPRTGWEIAKWNHEHEVARATNAMDWIEEYQAAVTESHDPDAAARDLPAHRRPHSPRHDHAR